jgi:enolase
MNEPPPIEPPPIEPSPIEPSPIEPSPVQTVRVRRVWDSRGRPTVEVELTTAAGAVGRGIAPSGASTGTAERLERRDGGDRLGGHDVRNVVRDAEVVLANALVGVPADWPAVDRVLEHLDPDRAEPVVGGNVLIACSLAAGWAGAAERGVPLWQHLAAGAATSVPLPEIQVIGGGAHARRSLDLQDLMVVAPGAASFAEALEWTTEVYLAAGRRLAPRGSHGVADEGGWWPVFSSNDEALAELTSAIADVGLRAPHDLAISIDVAATQLCSGGRGGPYRLATDERVLDREQMIEQVVTWCREHPVVLVEDPLHEDDVEGHRELRARLAGQSLVVGDDLLATDEERIRRSADAADVLLLKPNQVGTLSGARRALDEARRSGMRVIASARSGETEDVSIAHVAVGWGAELVKVGSVTRGERTAKWNELLRIAEVVPGFRGREALRLGGGA